MLNADAPQSNWTDARRRLHLTAECPHCHDDRQVERIDHQWFCQVCAKAWPVTPPERG